MPDKIQLAYNSDYALEKLKEFVAETETIRLSGSKEWPETDGLSKQNTQTEENN